MIFFLLWEKNMCRIAPVTIFFHVVTINRDLGRFLGFKKAQKHHKHAPYDLVRCIPRLLKSYNGFEEQKLFAEKHAFCYSSLIALSSAYIQICVLLLSSPVRLFFLPKLCSFSPVVFVSMINPFQTLKALSLSDTNLQTFYL